jgi:two-component system, response regulator / RNA-binding antiterminator
VPDGSENTEVGGLRVLVADGPEVRLDEVTQVLTGLGHEALPRDASADDLGALTRSENVDVAFVIVHEGTEHALQSIDRIVHESACPVIAVIDVEDRGFVNQAAQRGVFAYVVTGEDPQGLQSAIDIVLRRFREYHALEGAFGRRAVTERAKGVLMERHYIGEHDAFQMLRNEARRTRRKLVDVAETVLAAYLLLPNNRDDSDQ